MKRKIRRFACSNCGKPLKNRFIEFCPRCNARFSVKKIDFKKHFLVAPVGLLLFYALFYFTFTNIEDFSFRGVNTLEEFNIGMIFVSITVIVILLAFYFQQRKKDNKSKGKNGTPVNAKIEFRQFEIENDNKMIVLLIISFVIILPVILIPSYIEIKDTGVISSNTFLSVFLIILGVFVFILPFIIGYYTFEKPVKKLYEEEQ